MVLRNTSCIYESSSHNSTVVCKGTTYLEQQMLTYTDMYFWIYLGLYVFLVLFSGLLSGLKIAMFSLDYVTLEVLSTSGKPNEQNYAKRIMPLVKHQHLLLVTLVMSNAAIAVSLPIILQKITNLYIAIVVSITVVLFFGDALPHAVISRNGLAIGGILSPLVFLLLIVFFPLAWPLSKWLDCMLGSTNGTFFRRAELKSLVDLHLRKDEENEDPLTKDEAIIIKSVLTMRDKTVGQVCTSIDNMFALDVNDTVFNNATVDLVLKKCRYRVPVYCQTKSNLIGLLLLKSLIKLNPNDNISLKQIFNQYKQPLYKVSEKIDLYTALNFFQLGKGRLFAVVSQNCSDAVNSELLLLTPVDKVVGIVTLPDVIEELIKKDVFGEPNACENVHKRIFSGKARAAKLCLKKKQLAVNSK